MLLKCFILRAASDTRVWALERRVFQQIMVTTGIKRMEHQVMVTQRTGVSNIQQIIFHIKDISCFR